MTLWQIDDREEAGVDGGHGYDVTDFLQFTPAIQYVANPANDSETDDILVFGARLRTFF